MHRQFCLLCHGIMISLPPAAPFPAGEGELFTFLPEAESWRPPLGERGQKERSEPA